LHVCTFLVGGGHAHILIDEKFENRSTKRGRRSTTDEEKKEIGEEEKMG
jgi:hypothetical protein